MGKNCVLNTSGDDKKSRQIKQNNVNIDTYIGPSSHKVWLFKSSTFLKSRGVNFLSRDRKRTKGSAQ